MHTSVSTGFVQDTSSCVPLFSLQILIFETTIKIIVRKQDITNYIRKMRERKKHLLNFLLENKLYLLCFLLQILQSSLSMPEPLGFFHPVVSQETVACEV